MSKQKQRFIIKWNRGVSGQFAPAGEDILILQDRLPGRQVDAHLQLTCGGDIFRIDNPNGRGFKRRLLPNDVISPAWEATLAGNLYNALQGIGANRTAIPFPGFDDRIGLHRCLSSVPENPAKRTIVSDDASQGITVGSAHEINNTLVSSSIDAHLDVRRATSLEAGPYGTCIHINDSITALSPSYAGVINHPNPLLFPGDRVLMPWSRVRVALERDHVPPTGANPFIGVRPEFLGQAVNECCFFIYQRPDKNGWVVMLLLAADGKQGIGMRYHYHPDHPFLALWLSRGGYCGLESGNLPLGAKKLHELNMMPLLQQGDSWGNEYFVDLLNTRTDAEKFMKDFDINELDSGPTKIGVCNEDMHELVEAAQACNRSMA